MQYVNQSVKQSMNQSVKQHVKQFAGQVWTSGLHFDFSVFLPARPVCPPWLRLQGCC